MTPRERLRKVLTHELPDKVPACLFDTAVECYNKPVLELFRQKVGRHPRDCFDQDIRGVKFEERPRAQDWLERVRRIDKADQVRELMEPWIRTVNDLSRVKKQVEEAHRKELPALAFVWPTAFETGFKLRGREQFFMDIAYHDEWFEVFLDYLVEASIIDLRIAVEAGADICGIGDDLGSQRGLLISPDCWRSVFKPRLKKIIDSVRNKSRETAFFLHSDGDIRDIIPDLIEIGIDILNPIQPEVMDPAEIKNLYGRDLVFWGGISVQQTLPFGNPEEVADEVRLRMESIGRDGGYIISPSHMLNEDIPWENVAAFFDAIGKYGKYQL